MENNVRKGRCRNYGDCDKAGEEFMIEEGKPFECPECHQPLMPLDGPKAKGGKKTKGGVSPLVIGGGAVAVIAIAAGLYFALRTPGSPDSTVASAATEAPDSIAAVENATSNRSDTLVIKIEQEAVAEQPDTLPAEEVVEPAVTSETKPVSSKSPAQPSSHQLSYGKWTGGWKNGQPHGTGTLTYSTSHTIDSRDPKARVAQPGEYIVGEWDNGRLVQGRWFKNDGTKEAVIIGKAG